MKITKHFFLYGTLVIALLLASACSSAGNTPAPTNGQTTVEAPASGSIGGQATEVAPTTAPPSGPTEIRISYIQQFTDLNPLNVNNPAAAAVAYGLFDTLVQAKPDGTIIPWAADSWDISDDKLTMTFHLHKGIMFSDGTPLNADAVIFSADIFQDPKMFLGTSLPLLTAWKALDEYTVEFTFSQPDATALYNLAEADTSIVSPTAYQKQGVDDFGQHPVGSGPYILDHWEPGVEVVMNKNPNYWQQGVGLADKIVWRDFPDGAAAVLAAQSGELDLMHEQEAKDVPTFESISGFKVGTVEGGFYALVLNTQMPPFDKLENRQALAYAIDDEAILNVAFEGYAKPAIGAGVIPPSSWAYQPRDPIQRDTAKAKELLAAAGNPDGFEFKVTVTPQPIRSQILQIMQSNLAEVGINLNIEVNQFARHLEILQTDSAGANAAFVIQQTLYADPAQWLVTYTGCLGGFAGFTGYCYPNDTTFDDLVTKSRTLFDNEERKATIQQANQMLIDDLPVLTYAYQQTIHAWNADKLGDYVPNFEGGYNYLFLQPKY
jgi:peptide/nickel transport system substrate-binding protein